MTTPLKFVSVGFGNSVCANRIIAVMIPGSAPAKRRVKQAREAGAYIDLTFGHALKSILL